MKKHSPKKNSVPVVGKSNKAQPVEGLTPDVWNFRIDSYQICKIWFKARNGLPLNNEDTQRYQRMVAVLKDMVKLAEEIKTVFQYNQLKKLEIFEKLRFVVTEKLEIDPDKVTPFADFTEDLGADSLETIELFMALEEAFEIEIPAQVSHTLATVKQVIDYISQKVKIAV